jgi:hypothetical protein
VRGWSLTITAGIVAGTATRQVPGWFAFGAVVTTFLFKLSDDYQRRLRNIFTARALALERYFRETSQSPAYKHGVNIPYLANSVRDSSIEEARFKYGWPLTGYWSKTKQRLRHNWRRMVWRSESYFYRAQYAFAIFIAVIYLVKGKPAPSALEASVTSTLSGLTNSLLWKSGVITNMVVLQTPPLINSINITNAPNTNQILLTVPIAVTNLFVITNLGRFN